MYTNKITLFTMGNMYLSFSKMPILFFIYLEKIANIRKYRKNDDISPMVNSVKCTVLAYSGNPAMLFAYTVFPTFSATRGIEGGFDHS